MFIVWARDDVEKVMAIVQLCAQCPRGLSGWKAGQASGFSHADATKNKGITHREGALMK